MAFTTTLIPGGVLLDDGAGHQRLIKIEPQAGSDNLAMVNCYNGATNVGTPLRIKMTSSGGRLAGDYPGIDPNFFMVGPDGHITNG